MSSVAGDAIVDDFARLSANGMPAGGGLSDSDGVATGAQSPPVSCASSAGQNQARHCSSAATSDEGQPVPDADSSSASHTHGGRRSAESFTAERVMTDAKLRSSTDMSGAAGSLSIIFMAVCCSVAGYWFAMRRQVFSPHIDSTGSGVLTVDDQYLNFGNVVGQPAFLWKIPVHNDCVNDVEIHGFQTSCSCTSVSPSRLTIPAGQSRLIHVELNLRSTTLRGAAEIDRLQPRAFSTSIVPQVSNIPLKQPIIWMLEGTVTPHPISTSPSSIDLQCLRNHKYFTTKEIRGQTAPIVVDSAKPLKRLEVSVESSLVVLSKTRVDGDGRIWQLDVAVDGRSMVVPLKTHIRLCGLTGVDPNHWTVDRVE